MIFVYAAYVSMTLSGLQGQILQLLVGISTAAAAFATVCGLAWLYGHDLTGLLSRSRDLPITPDTGLFSMTRDYESPSRHRWRKLTMGHQY